jgi:uncharacterized protein YabE (DUF348 family)
MNDVKPDMPDNDHKPPKKVEVEVDTKKREVRPGAYVVSDFKAEVHVPAEKELDQVINGVITPLDDTATITIRGGEVFVSHVRTGGAS